MQALFNKPCSLRLDPHTSDPKNACIGVWMGLWLIWLFGFLFSKNFSSGPQREPVPLAWWGARPLSARPLHAYKPTWRGMKPACAHHCAGLSSLLKKTSLQLHHEICIFKYLRFGLAHKLKIWTCRAPLALPRPLRKPKSEERKPFLSCSLKWCCMPATSADSGQPCRLAIVAYCELASFSCAPNLWLNQKGRARASVAWM